MFIALALALLQGAAPASAGNDFATRVQQAKLAEAATTGAAYQKALWGQIGKPTADAYKACILADKATGKAPFTLVLDTDAQGKPQHIEVQPVTPVASCMAGHFARWTLPVPPAAPAPYPLEVDFSVTGGE